MAAFEAEVWETKQRPAPVVVVKTAIARYLADLRVTLDGDIDEAQLGGPGSVAEVGAGGPAR